MRAHNVNAGSPHIFRTYNVDQNQEDDCTIWEALRATFAHPDFFDRMSIGPPGMEQLFVDGGFGCNNPVAQVLSEARLAFPDRDIACVISIGAGVANVIQMTAPNPLQRLLPLDTFKAVKAIATDCDRVSDEMDVRFRDVEGVYFRFSTLR